MKIERLIAKIKKDNSYSIKSSYTNKELFKILYYRGMQVFRGFWAKLFYLKTAGLLFKGKKVTVRHAHLIRGGKNLILGDNVLIDALSENGIELGDNVTIERNSTLICTGVIANKGTGIKIGNNTGINAYSFLGGQGGITIGNYVIIGPHVQIFSENHIYNGSDNIRNQGETRQGVIIEDNCWIGADVKILDGVIIREKTVVAAGSVVTKSFDSNVLIGGVPAKLLKKI
jgi:acetyltransferase-like isoleucine patch superfamily enzyme